MTRTPRPLTTASFHVLDLLAHLLEHGLCLDDGRGDLRERRLAPDRVELAPDLLNEEVEAAAARRCSRDQRARLLEVTLEPDELLADVRALREHGELAREQPWIEPAEHVVLAVARIVR